MKLPIIIYIVIFLQQLANMARELSPELAKIAKDELNENPKQLNDDLNYLKDWISKQPHLKARTGKFSLFHCYRF